MLWGTKNLKGQGFKFPIFFLNAQNNPKYPRCQPLQITWKVPCNGYKGPTKDTKPKGQKNFIEKWNQDSLLKPHIVLAQIWSPSNGQMLIRLPYHVHSSPNVNN